ncbi:MAG: gliding motility protein GldN [Bacteroidota bacterium]
MKKIIVKSLLVLAVAVFTVAQVNAQGKYGKAPAKQPATPTTKPDTTIKQTGGVGLPNGNAKGIVQQPAVTPVTNATGNISVKLDTTNPGGLDAKPQISLRNNSAIDRSQVKDRKPLEYEYLRMDDEMWSEYWWLEIDAREKMNQSFMYPGKDDNGDQRFFAIMLNAIKNDSVTAFSPDDDRFTTPLTNDQIFNQTASTFDTVDVADPVTGAIERIITKKAKFNPDSIYTFRIKEQLIFDKEKSRLYTRILGIAPIAKQLIGGKSIPRILFWIYYPDLRKTLAKVDVYNPKNNASRMTWEELFENRFYSSYLIKSSANNPSDKYLNAMIKDPLFRLLEGENIKTRVFNYEQDLWQY